MDMKSVNHLQYLGKKWSAEPLDNANMSEPHPTLRVVTFDDPLFISVKLQSNGSYRYSGYLYDLWKILASNMGLNYKMVPMPINDYGTLDANGTWTGLVGELAYGRADVALASLDMTSDRASVIDFLDACPVDQSNSGFYVRRGPRETPQLSSLLSLLLKPLDTSVWWALLVSLLLLAVILRISLHFNRGGSESQQTADEMPWTTCLFSCYMSIVGQGWSNTPKSVATRMVTIACWILGIITYASYTANMISHLTVVTEQLPINSLEEFLERPDWELAVPVGTSQLSEWRLSSDVHERALYQRYATGKGVVIMNLTSTGSRRYMLKERVLTHIDFNYIPLLLGGDACLLAPLPGRHRVTVPTFIAVAKRTNRLRRRINYMLLKMATGGLITRLRHRWKNSSEIVCEDPTGYKVISFGDSLAVLVIVPLSLCVSMAVLLLERAFSFQSGNGSGNHSIAAMQFD